MMDGRCSSPCCLPAALAALLPLTNQSCPPTCPPFYPSAGGGRKRPLMPNLAELLEEEEEGFAAAGEAGRRSDGAALLPAERASVESGALGALGSGSPPHKFPRKEGEEGEGDDAEDGGYMRPPPPRPSSVAETDVEVLQARVHELQTQVRMVLGWVVVCTRQAGWVGCLHWRAVLESSPALSPWLRLLPFPHSPPSRPTSPAPYQIRTTSCSGSWTT